MAGWRSWMTARHSAAMTTWFVQLALNFLWTPVFFGAHQIGFASAIILALLATIAVFSVQRWGRDSLAAALFLPYAVWVAFATLLNGAIRTLN
jgi:tryptophan-rich sensory protein